MRIGRALCPAVCLVLAACGKPTGSGESSGPTVVAEIGERRITAAELVTESVRRAGSRRQPVEKEQVLSEMLHREALLLRARQAGIDQDPAVKREIEGVLIGRLLAAELEPRREAITVADDEVKAEYESTKQTSARLAQARLAVLFLATGARASETRKAEARTRLEEARNKFSTRPREHAGNEVGFGPLAAEYSDDQVSRYRGGDLGWLQTGKSPARVPACVIDKGWALPRGQPSEILETGEGFYVVLKTDSREPSVTPFETVQASVRQNLLVRKRKQLDEQFQAEMAQLFPSRVHTQSLASVTLPALPAALAASNREPQPPAIPGIIPSPHGN